MMTPEREPHDDNAKAFYYLGQYVVAAARKVGQAGGRMCSAIARASAESDPEWRPSVRNGQGMGGIVARMRARDDQREFEARILDDIDAITQDLTLDARRQLLFTSPPHHHED